MFESMYKAASVAIIDEVRRRTAYQNRHEIRVEYVEHRKGRVIAKVSTFVMSKDVGDYGLEDTYESFDNMPQWLQTKLIKLQILPEPPPKQSVLNVGVRMAPNVYWIVAPEDEIHGDDT